MQMRVRPRAGGRGSIEISLPPPPCVQIYNHAVCYFRVDSSIAMSDPDYLDARKAD